MTSSLQDAVPIQGGGRQVKRLAFHPQTFEQQGAIVPFTTRILSQARVRLSSERRGNDEAVLEALLPGFAGSESTYVTTLGNLSDVVTMSVHDRALAKTLMERRAHRPADVRMCWVEVATSGLAGAREARKAKGWRAAMKQTVDADRIVLIRHLARRQNIAIPEMIFRKLEEAPDSGGILLQALHGIGSKGGLDAGVIGMSLVDIADLMSGIGLKGAKTPGMFRDLTCRLGELARMMEEWGRQTMSDIGPSASACGRSAAMSYEMAQASLERIDALSSPVADMLVSWPKGKLELRREIDRLAWLLDGWDYVIDLWLKVVTRKVTAEDAINEMFRILPIVPPGEMPDEHGGRASAGGSAAGL